MGKAAALDGSNRPKNVQWSVGVFGAACVQGEVRNTGDLVERDRKPNTLSGVARLGVGGAHGTDEAGNERGGTEPWFRVLRKEWTSGRLVMSLIAQIKLEEFREKLYVKAKTEQMRRHKLPRATSRFGYNEVHGRLGVIEVRRLLSSHACT